MTARPNFFLIAPDRAPRTECACQPVALQSSAMLAPFGRRRDTMIDPILPLTVLGSDPLRRDLDG